MATSVALSKETDEVPLYAAISYSKRQAASRASTVNEILFPAGKSLFLRSKKKHVSSAARIYE
jgi:hypothetical protein